MKITHTAVFAIVLGARCTGSSADVINVPTAEHPTIQSGISAALAGDEVLVAPGGYNESIDFLGKAITVRGSEGAAVTMITGVGGPVVTGVFDFGDGGAVVRFEGFTIAGGSGFDDQGTLRGGGFYAHGPSADIFMTDCYFTRNDADEGGGVWTNADLWLTDCTFEGNTGWAVRAFNQPVAGWVEPTLTLDNCEFNNNPEGAVSLEGELAAIDCSFFANASVLSGAIYQETHQGGDASMLRCTFENNVGSSGGAVWISLSPALQPPGAATFEQCEFRNNTGSSGGAMNVVGTEIDLTVADSVFENNAAAESWGGAIRIFALPDLAVNIDRCDFVGNSALAEGGGLYIIGDEGSLNVQKCRFVENSSGGDGGAAWVKSDGVGFNQYYNACEFSCNTASIGGALRLTMFNPVGNQDRIVNSTFFRNEAEIEGGAVYTFGNNGIGPKSRFLIVNCTMVLNQAPNQPAVHHHGVAGGELEIYNSVFWASGDAEIGGHGGGITMAYSNSLGVYPGEGNINMQPYFHHGAEGDFRLRFNSPFIDAGSNEFAALAGPLDFAGGPRMADDPFVDDCQFAENCGDAPIVDIGAFERLVPTGDLNNDGAVDAADLAILLGAWGPCPNCPPDLNGDGVVNAADLAILLGNWG